MSLVALRNLTQHRGRWFIKTTTKKLSLDPVVIQHTSDLQWFANVVSHLPSWVWAWWQATASPLCCGGEAGRLSEKPKLAELAMKMLFYSPLWNSCGTMFTSYKYPLIFSKQSLELEVIRRSFNSTRCVVSIQISKTLMCIVWDLITRLTEWLLDLLTIGQVWRQLRYKHRIACYLLLWKQCVDSNFNQWSFIGVPLQIYQLAPWTHTFVMHNYLPVGRKCLTKS